MTKIKDQPAAWKAHPGKSVGRYGGHEDREQCPRHRDNDAIHKAPRHIVLREHVGIVLQGDVSRIP